MLRLRRTATTIAVAVALAAMPGLLSAPATAAPVTTARSVERVQRWSDPRTWGGGLPERGDVVVVPSGARVVLDVSPPALAGLRVDGRLAFARKDVALEAAWIVVHGTFRVGTERKPFRQDATITLTGSPSDADVMGMGTKVLGVMGGVLDLHGRPVRSWTRLGATADAGDSAITLEEPSRWGPGDRIVVASTDYWSSHAEERTIVRVDGAVAHLDRPLAYRHWGEVQDFGGAVADERAEVGLLGRNVVVRGDASSSETGFGGHLMVMEGSVARVDGVELAAMGQRKRLRRYPVHFHMEGDAPGSYLKRSVVRDSFNRCVVVHGTGGLVVSRNVCNDHAGHGFFLEDGSETGNVIEHNLGLGTRAVEDGLLPTDAQPATFWITNPDNVLRGNVAAGSEGTGIWYALPEHPTGLSASAGVWPRRTPLGEFRDNVAHSNNVDGLAVTGNLAPDGGFGSGRYTPLTDPMDPRSAPAPATFDGLTSYMNRWRGAWFGGAHLVLTRATLADNRTGASFASSEAFLEDSLVVGESANAGTPEPWEETGPRGRALPAYWLPHAPVTGFEFYDGRVGVRDTTFASFASSPSRRSAALTYRESNPFNVDPGNFVEGARFLDAERVYFPEPQPRLAGDSSSLFVDRDGSVTDAPGTAVVNGNPFLADDGCRARPEWNARLCDTEYVSLGIGVVDGPSAAIDPVRLTRGDGVAQELGACCSGAREVFGTVGAAGTYAVSFHGGTPARAKFVLWNARGRWVHLSVPVRGPVRVTGTAGTPQEVSGLGALAAGGPTAYYLDRAASTLHLRISARSDWDEVYVETR
jgi:hypothetical protein